MKTLARREHDLIVVTLHDEATNVTARMTRAEADRLLVEIDVALRGVYPPVPEPIKDWRHPTIGPP